MKRPPGPTSMWMGVELLSRLRADILAHCRALRDEFGDAVSYRLGPALVFQWTHPEQIHEILTVQNEHFTKPKRMKEVLGKWDGNGLVLNEGPSWVRQRRLVQPGFRPQRIQSYAELIRRRARDLAASWPAQGQAEIGEAMSHLALGIVAESLFGADAARFEEEFTKQVAILNEEAMVEISSPFLLPDWWPSGHKRRMLGAAGFLDRVVREIIAERRKDGVDRGDLLSNLLLAVDEEGDRGRMSDQQARDEAVVLMLAGGETTATALVWTLYLLAEHPAIQEEVAAECARAEASDVEQLPLTEAVFKESMRLYPPAYLFAREAKDDVQIGGFDVPAGSLIHILPYFTHHDARWFEAPEQFRPQRFAGNGEDALPRCAYLPFGAGPRACIGRRLAMMEGVLVLAELLRAARFASTPSSKNVVMEAQVSLHPKGGLTLGVERRGRAAG